MPKLIRNYNAGARVVLTAWANQNGIPDAQLSPAEKERRAAAQAYLEAEQMRQQAAEVLVQAQQAADALRQDVQVEIATLQAEAQARGYEEGYQEGIVQGRQKVESAQAAVVANLQEVLRSLETQRALLLQQAEVEVATLAVAIAEKIVGQIAEDSRPLIVHTAKRALAQLSTHAAFRLRVHPSDLSVLEQYWKQVENQPPENSWELIGDAAVEPGGCLLRCGPMTVDARLSTQLQTVIDGLQLADYKVHLPRPENSDQQT